MVAGTGVVHASGLAWVSAFAVVVGALAALAFRFGVPWAADALLGALVLGWMLVVLMA